MANHQGMGMIKSGYWRAGDISELYNWGFETNYKPRENILRKMNNTTNFRQFSIASITTIIKQRICREEEKDSIVKNIMK